MGEPHRRPHVQIEVALLVGVRVRGKVEVEPEPGVVDEHLDRASGIGEAGCHPVEPVRIDEVCGQHLDGDTGGDAQRAGEAFESLGVTGHQNEVCAARGELARELRAES